MQEAIDMLYIRNPCDSRKNALSSERVEKVGEATSANQRSSDFASKI